MADFVYQDPFPLSKDETQYRLLTKNFVSEAAFDGTTLLKVDPEGLTLLAREAMRDVSFLLRTAHLQQVAAILDDPEASANDRGVALAMLVVAASQQACAAKAAIVRAFNGWGVLTCPDDPSAFFNNEATGCLGPLTAHPPPPDYTGPWIRRQ